MGKIEVRIDAINHLVPKNVGKKEWYIISCSKYDERDNFIGWEHLEPVFLTPLQYNQSKDAIEVGIIVDAIYDSRVFNGKISNIIIGFETN